MISHVYDEPNSLPHAYNRAWEVPNVSLVQQSWFNGAVPNIRPLFLHTRATAFFGFIRDHDQDQINIYWASILECLYLQTHTYLIHHHKGVLFPSDHPSPFITNLEPPFLASQHTKKTSSYRLIMTLEWVNLFCWSNYTVIPNVSRWAFLVELIERFSGDHSVSRRKSKPENGKIFYQMDYSSSCVGSVQRSIFTNFSRKVCRIPYIWMCRWNSFSRVVTVWNSTHSAVRSQIFELPYGNT